MRLRNGLGRFCSSERLYPFDTGIAAAVFIPAHGSADPGRELTDFEGRDDDVSHVGAEADTGRVIAFWRGALRTDPLMDGFRRRVGGTAVEYDGSLVDEADAVILELVLSHIDGHGGKSMSPSPSSTLEFSLASSKSNILANLIMTLHPGSSMSWAAALGDQLGLDQFRLIKTARQRRRGGEEAVDSDGGRRYTATHTEAGRPNRSFATGGGWTGKNSWNFRRTISPNKTSLCGPTAWQASGSRKLIRVTLLVSWSRGGGMQNS